MNDHENQNETTRRNQTSARRWGTAAALVAAGLAGGVVLAGTVTANAADTTPTPSATSGTVPGAGTTAPDPSKPMHSDETLLTGDVAAKVTAAALAKYPGATIQRVETDSDGVYEAHLVTTDSKHLVVAVDKSYAVTGTQEMTGRGPGGGRGGPGAGETALTGDVAAKVKAAALAKYPSATVERVETDNGGVYEAHIVTADNKHLVVAVDKSYAVTGTQEMTGRGPGMGMGGPIGSAPSTTSGSTTGSGLSSSTSTTNA